MRLMDLFKSRTEVPGGSLESLLHGAMELSGGLVQAMGPDIAEIAPGLCVVQLRRALRGAAFAFGALFPLRESGTIDQGVFDELRQTIEGLQAAILPELRALRGRRERD